MDTCLECGNHFEKKSYQQLYCSSNCKTKSNRKKNLQKKHEDRFAEFEKNKISICPVCGIKFERVFSSTWRQQIYCSKTCRNKKEYASQIKRDNDLRYKDLIRFDGNREHVLKRDNCKCQFCNTSEQLVVHHLDGSGKLDEPNNEMDNLVTLCKKCHAKLHKYIDAYRR